VPDVRERAAVNGEGWSEESRRRGLVTGCDCGCRGDWELTAAGLAVLR